MYDAAPDKAPALLSSKREPLEVSSGGRFHHDLDVFTYLDGPLTQFFSYPVRVGAGVEPAHIPIQGCEPNYPVCILQHREGEGDGIGILPVLALLHVVLDVVHGIDDVGWTDDVEVALGYLREDLERMEKEE